MEQPDPQQPPAPPPPGARQKRGPSRATSAPSQPQAPHPETTVLWTDGGAARASPQQTTITSQQLPPALQEKVQRSDTLASQKTRPVSHIAAAAANGPVIEALINAGANRALKTKKGESARDLVKDNAELVALFRAAHAAPAAPAAAAPAPDAAPAAPPVETTEPTSFGDDGEDDGGDEDAFI